MISMGWLCLGGLAQALALAWPWGGANFACSANHRHGDTGCALEPLPKGEDSVLAQLVVCDDVVGGHLLVVVHLIAHLWWHACAFGRTGRGALGSGIGPLLRKCRMGHRENRGI